MSIVTQILEEVESGDASAADRLLPLVYDELRKLAAAKMAKENPGQTLQATALVHEAYIRLVDVENTQHWDSRGHFFAAAAEAMRRILVENARRKLSLKRGGNLRRRDFNIDRLGKSDAVDELLAIDEALDNMTRENPTVAEFVRLRYFAGLTVEQAASVLGVNVRTGHRYWAYARAWLHNAINGDPLETGSTAHI